MPSEYIAGASNYYSYNAIDMYLFLGFTPQLTKLRRHLNLPAWPNPSTAPAHSITNLKIPFTYMWSPSLQPKPEDWGPHLGVRVLPPPEDLVLIYCSSFKLTESHRGCLWRCSFAEFAAVTQL